MWLIMTQVEQQLQRDVYQTCSEYMNTWVLPKSRSENLPSLFAPKRKQSNKDAKTFKCTASEGLSVMTPFLFFLLQIIGPLGICQEQIAAYACLVNVLELLQATALGTTTTPTNLATAITAFLEACQTAGWKDEFHPKFHWILHMPRQLARWGFLPSCFVQERKHKVAKRYGGRTTNTQGYEKTLLLELLGHNIADLQEPDIFGTAAKLMQKCKAPNKMVQFMNDCMGYPAEEIFTCSSVQLEPAGICHRGDLVVMRHGMQIAEVWFHCYFDGQLFSLVSFLETVKYEKQSWTCRKTEETMVVSTEEIKSSLSYSRLNDVDLRVIVPLPHRQ